ncbi:MAG: hypothetical protein WC384_07535 [Prolixibacteraceae bacterium]|jgi:hypothetical protein
MEWNITIATYRELFKTKEIKSFVPGAHTDLMLKINLTGDIMVFLHPKSEVSLEQKLRLIDRDIDLPSQKTEALKILQEKIQRILSVPRIISFVIIIVVTIVSSYFFIEQVTKFISESSITVSQILGISSPILPIVGIYFRKKIGFKIVSFIMSKLI